MIYEELSRFPLEREEIAPTRLGNALRSFETYGATRYNLDSQTLWTELCSVVPKYLQDELDRSRATVDFFIALFYLTILFALATLILAGVPSFKPQLIFIAIPALLLPPFWYRMAVVSSSYWSTTVQALVNLGRKKLAEEMGLQMPATLEEERKMWGLLTSFVYYGNMGDGEKLDRFRVRPVPKPFRPIRR